MSDTFTVKPDYADYRAANWLIYRKTWLSLRTLRIPLALIAIFFALNLFVTCFDCEFSTDILWWAFREALLPAIGGTIVAMAFCAFSMAVQIRKTFKQLGTVEEEVEFSFSDSGFVGICETGSTNLEWKHLKDFVLTKRLLILRRTVAMMYLIPVARLEPEVLKSVIAKLRAGGVRQG